MIYFIPLFSNRDDWNFIRVYIYESPPPHSIIIALHFLLSTRLRVYSQKTVYFKWRWIANVRRFEKTSKILRKLQYVNLQKIPKKGNAK